MEFPDELEKVCQELRLKSNDKMSTELVQAMLDDCGISLAGYRKMKHFFNAAGFKILVSERRLRLLGGKDPIPPEYNTCKWAGKTLSYWTKSAVKLLKYHLTRMLTNSWTIVRIFFAADHGQGAEQMTIEVKAYNAEDVVMYNDVFRIGELECNKDYIELLCKTLLPSVNESLKTILRNKVATGPGIDGSLCFFEADDDADEENASGTLTFVDSDYDDSHAKCIIPFRVSVIGDSAAYAAFQGRENCEGSQCMKCQLKKKEWQDVDKICRGEPWTYQQCLECGEEAERTNEKVQGFKTKPPLILIAPDRYEYTHVHCVLGAGNTLCDRLYTYIAKRVGLSTVYNRNEELGVAYSMYAEAKSEYLEAKEAMETFDRSSGKDLQMLKNARSLVIAEKERKDITKEEKKKLEQERVALYDEIQQAEAEKKTITTYFETVKKEYDEKLKAFEEIKKEYNCSDSKPLKARIEDEAFSPHGARAGVAHGGDMIGAAIRKLMENARLICPAVASILIEVATENGMYKPGLESIRLLCEYMRDYLVLMDGFFSVMQTSPSDFVEEHREEARLYIKHAMILWEAMGFLPFPPKHHMNKDHACDEMPLHIDENNIEKSHQIRVWNRNRNRGFRDKKRKFESDSEWENRNRAARTDETKKQVRDQVKLSDETLELRRENKRAKEAAGNGPIRYTLSKEERNKLRRDTLAKWKNKEPEQILTWEQENLREEMHKKQEQ